MFTLRQLEFAISVAKYQHFRRAAEECNVSQSALSLGVAALEDQLGLQLFERNNKQVLITPAGLDIIERAQSILTDSHDLLHQAKFKNEPLSSSMKIGLIPTIAPYLLPKVLPKLTSDHPDFHFEICEETSERLIEKVRSGVIDTAVLELPYPISGLHTFEFWEEDFKAVVGQQSSQFGLPELLISKLDSEELMLLGDGHCLSDQTLSLCQLQDSESVKRFEHASLNTLIQMALGSFGVTIVPELALDQLKIADHERQVLPLSEPGPHRRLAFISRLNYARTDDVQYLCRSFKESLTKATAEAKS